jgi:DNA (cytosine-5)-methyltransferase 1
MRLLLFMQHFNAKVFAIDVLRNQKKIIVVNSQSGSRSGRIVAEKPFVEEENLVSRSKIKLVDLFAGIGGFHYGVAAAAAKINKGVKPLLVSEIEPSCQETYRLNHVCDVQGDINKITLRGITDTADVVTAGFPCQPFSNSGLKLGLSDPRGQFYFKIEEIIKKYDAKSFILENVSGIRFNGGGKYPSLLSTQPQLIGKSMKFLEENLAKLRNYHIKWQEIDSSQLGSPQVRKRVYIVGIHKDFTKELSLQFRTYKPNPFISIVDDQIIEELELSENQEKNLRSFMTNPPSFHDGMRRVGQAYLCAGGNVGQGYHAYGMVPTLTKVWARFLPIYFPHPKENLPRVSEREFKPNSFYGKGYFRRASVREVMRLQGFPDSFSPHAKDSLAYEHAGNAVNAKIVREIADNLLGYIKK